MSKIKNIIWPQVILFGDSITQFSFQPNGWGSEIANKLARIHIIFSNYGTQHKIWTKLLPPVENRKCDVVNRGLSGYNSRWAKIVLPRLISKDTASSNHIAAVTVFFGANDCSLEDKNPQQHIPLQEYSNNLKDIVKHLGSVGVSADKVIFITLPPLHEPAWEKECVLKGSALNRLNSVAGQYAQACVQAAGQCGADVLDLWTLMQKDGQDFTGYLSDGLHLSEKGNQFVSQHLWRLLKSRVEELPFILPYWGDVDPKQPESSLLCD